MTGLMAINTKEKVEMTENQTLFEAVIEHIKKHEVEKRACCGKLIHLGVTPEYAYRITEDERFGLETRDAEEIKEAGYKSSVLAIGKDIILFDQARVPGPNSISSCKKYVGKEIVRPKKKIPRSKRK